MSNVAQQAQPRITIVVPCYNCADVLSRLVTSVIEAEALGPRQLILVDDGSRDGTAEVIRGFEADHGFIEAIYEARNQGAGIARNHAFARARGTYTLFFDADDVLHADALEAALAQLDETDADLAVLPYSYDRGDGSGYVAMNNHDARVWQGLMGDEDSRVCVLDDAAGLLGMSNYPWNKVMRTDTYRRAGLRFGRTPVNNDILGHWHAFLHADRIVLLNAVLCTHHVAPDGANLTNRSSAERLALFEALDETYDLIEAHPLFRSRYAHHYWAFAHRTILWARDRIDRAHQMELAIRAQDHVARINLSDYFSISAKRDPRLARDLARLLYN
jgi:glycosyltransferase involved in cell wall biosynthesis